MKLHAFISYSHGADGHLAPRLQSGLQRFAKPWWKRRALRIFRDETGLSAHPHLWGSIEQALSESEWFIFLASPLAAQSEWVKKEITWWLDNRDPDRILPVVTDGALIWDSKQDRLDLSVSTAIPDILAETWKDEPRWVDLRWARDEGQLDLRNTRFRSVLADIAAPLHGIAKDELESEELRQHRRTLRIASAAVLSLIILTAAAIGAGVLAIGQRNEARQQSRVSLARAVATQAVADSTARLDRGLLLGAHALGMHEDEATRGGLLTALESARHLVEYKRELGNVTTSGVSSNGKWVFTGQDTTLRKWNAQTWELEVEVTLTDFESIWRINILEDDEYIWITGSFPNSSGSRIFRIDDLQPASILIPSESEEGLPKDWSFRVDRMQIIEHRDGLLFDIIDAESGKDLTQVDFSTAVDCESLYHWTVGPTGQMFLECPGSMYLADLDEAGADPTRVDLETFESDISASVFSSDGSEFVFAVMSGELIVVDTKTGAVRASSALPDSYGALLTVDRSGDRIAVVESGSQRVSVWTVGSRLSNAEESPLIRLGLLEGFYDEYLGVGFLPRSDESTITDEIRVLVSAPSVGVSIWDLAQESVIGAPIRDQISQLEIDPTRGLAYVVQSTLSEAEENTASEKTEIEVVSLDDGRPIRSLSVATGSPAEITALSKGGEFLLVTAFRWLDEEQLLRDPTSYRLLVVSTVTGQIVDDSGILEIPLSTQGATEPYFEAAAWSPDRTRVAGLVQEGDSSGRLLLIDLDTATVRSTDFVIDDWNSSNTVLEWTDQNEIAVGRSREDTITFVGPDSGKEIESVVLRPGSWSGVVDISVTPNGPLAIAGILGVHLIDPISRDPIGGPFEHRSASMLRAVLSDDARTLAALQQNGNLRLWDVESGRPLGQGLTTGGDLLAWPKELTFLPNGSIVTALDPDFEGTFTIQRWNLATDHLVEIACRLSNRDLTLEEWRTYVDSHSEPEPVCR